MSQQDSWPPSIDPPATSLGRLQRGLGAGVRELLARRVDHALDLVLECIREDPRWDTQLDSRDDCYARLALQTGATVEPIEDAVYDAESVSTEIDRGASLALDVLERMAGLGNQEAVDAIRRYIARGRYWASAINGLVCDHWSAGPDRRWRERTEGVAEIVLARFPATVDLRGAIAAEWTIDARRVPWSEWQAEYPPIREAFAARTDALNHAGEQKKRLAEMSTEELLAAEDAVQLRAVARSLESRRGDADLVAMLRVAGDSSRPMHLAALNALAVQQHSEVLPSLLSLVDGIERGQRRALVAGALRALPYTATRETVTSWLSSGKGKRRSLAAYVLAKQAIAEDSEQIAAELDVELDAGLEGDQYVICSLAEALGRHPDTGPHNELSRAFNEMPYSYGRHFVVDAIASTDPAFPDDLAVDCLWDAEPAVRATGARHASRMDAGSARRLDEIRADANEEPAVRAAAA